MQIQDIKGNNLSYPNLEKGRIEPAYSDDGIVYVYFINNTDEQQAYELINNANIQQDKAQCAIYEASSQSFSETEPFSCAYARRIQRGEIAIIDCPSELQAEITLLVYPYDTSIINCTATNGEFDNYDADQARCNSARFTLLPTKGGRVPSSAELSEHLAFSAKDDNDAEIADYFDTYCHYEVNECGFGEFTIMFSKECKSIDLNVSCITE